MAQVTVELGNLLRTDFELFDFGYEFDDKKFAKKLEEAVIEYYWDYEIGRETPDSFKRAFKYRWNRAMEYYNKLHNTTLLEYNPLINYKMSEALEKLSEASRTQDTLTDSEGSNKTTGTSTVEGGSNTTGSSNEDIESSSTDHTEQNTSNQNTRTDDLKSTSITDEQASDYPQQSIAGGDYLSGARQSDNATTNTGTVQDSGSSDNISDSTSTGNSIVNRENQQNTTSNSNRTDEQNTTTTTNQVSKVTGKDNANESYEKTIEGMTGKTYQELIQLERDNLIRITGMVIEELKPCFILVH